MQKNQIDKERTDFVTELNEKQKLNVEVITNH